ncbi:MAG: hypothetical protein LBV41_08020, partial [Cytophagaceae bacterium]|nr:hypothetical protein [Cytophagaceae bacterium]
WFSDKWSSVEQIIASHPDISHILVGLDSETQIENIPVNKLQSVVSGQKQSLIVYCDTQVEGINDLFGGAIDFMIAGIANEPLCSFVVARRSKLVQTEGRSCSFCLDLYSYWQWSMRNRESVIEPMRI